MAAINRRIAGVHPARTEARRSCKARAWCRYKASRTAIASRPVSHWSGLSSFKRLTPLCPTRVQRGPLAHVSAGVTIPPWTLHLRESAGNRPEVTRFSHVLA
jgi:hypothetical protein